MSLMYIQLSSLTKFKNNLNMQAIYYIPIYVYVFIQKKELLTMPLYDLRCQNCQKEYQVMISFSKLADVKCPSCGSEKNERIYKVNVKDTIVSGASQSRSHTSPLRGFT